MSSVMTISDQTLMAYVDGELDAETRAAVEASMASDPGVAKRVARQRALRKKLRAEYDRVLAEAVPDRLLATARTAPAAPPEATVTDLARARARRAAHAGHRWSWPQWGAVAASLVLGVLLGQALLRSPGAGPIDARDGRLVAQGALAEALSEQLASSQAIDARIGMGLSFRSRSGDYCRTFVLREGPGLAGLACRERNDWVVQMIAPNEAPTAAGDYRMAGAELPLLVLKAVEEHIQGDPLDTDGEAAARASDWR